MLELPNATGIATMAGDAPPAEVGSSRGYLNACRHDAADSQRKPDPSGERLGIGHPLRAYRRRVDADATLLGLESGGFG